MRSEQLLRMADLLEKHPRMPKVAVDPSQEPGRNISHVVMGICPRAKKAFNVRFLSDDAKGSLYMKSELFGLVPFDKDLDILIQTLQSGSYLETIEGDLTGFIRVVTVPIIAGWSSRSIVEIKEFRVNNNYLGCVLKGLPYVYPKRFYRDYQDRIRRISHIANGVSSPRRPCFSLSASTS